MMKLRTLRNILVVLVLFAAAAFGLWQIPAVQQFVEPYNSASIYVYDLTEGREVQAVNADQARAPASLTKMATTLVALRHLDDLSKPAPIDKQSYERAAQENLSMAGFEAGERTTYRDLLYGTMLASGGEAADSLAINATGSIKQAVTEMNALADELGLTNTHFVNVDGMDAQGQTMSARDAATLLRAGLEDGDFKVLATKPEFRSSKTKQHPKGVLLQHTILKRIPELDTSGFTILGGKSGTTTQAGLCWATLDEKNGHQYLVVVMGAPLDDVHNPGDGHIQDTLRILRNL